MGISQIGAYTAYSSIAAEPQKRQSTAAATAVSASPASGGADKVSISQAARSRATEESKEGGSYDFTNMAPKQMWGVAQELYESGKISEMQRFVLLTVEVAVLASKGNGDSVKGIMPTDAEIARLENTPINYVQYCKERVAFLESSGFSADPQSGYEAWKGLVSFFQGGASSPHFS